MSDSITILQTETGILELTPAADGRFTLTVHSRPEDRDRFDDLSVDIGTKELAMMAQIGAWPPANVVPLLDAEARAKKAAADARHALACMQWLGKHFHALVSAINEVVKEPREKRLEALEDAIAAWHTEFENDQMPSGAPRSKQKKIDVREYVRGLDQ